MKQKIVNCYLFAVLVLIDQITKLIFSSRDFFIGPLHIHPVQNYGLSFSLDFGFFTNLVLIGLGLLFFTVYYFKHRQEFLRHQQFIFIFIFAGGLSNIIDRLYFGYVRDFLDMGLGFTFNLADTFVIAGLIMLLIPQKDGDKISN